ncbi:ABC transporter, phosphonate, substrate-binding protein [Malonomonas rubra DSM 5091]|uniref:ABC transporter, phosphonate, substrate-binding protein n=1 Tax=Malonomonas rubra DSM 5091 TaxID=1122189 RepID=A0A1M6NEJ4_MALRU|nr:PhnD/SsuA/transferrin family substrate-binding protein [Malonomonas rubra]SHJ94034.1 ABC transporter, phosphonate, substrate-binding protein [Malonomonas rubra DSM 5091]
MRYLLANILISLVLSFLPFSCLAESGMIRLGFTINVFSKSDRNDASSALKAWASAVTRERSIHDQVTINVFDSVEEVQQRFAAKELDGATVNADEMLKIHPLPEFVYLPIVNNKPEVQYIILVNKNGATSLDKVRSGKVAFFEGQRMSLGRMWFDGLLIEEGIHNLEIVPEEKVSNAIFKVFFRQADAAIVTAEAFNLAVELNPQLGKDLLILKQSEPLIPGIFVFRSTWTGRSADVMDEALSQLHTTPGGQQVLTVFQSSRMEKLSVETLFPTLEFVKRHHQLLQ